MVGVRLVVESEFLAMVNRGNERLVGIGRVVWRTSSASSIPQDGFHLGVGEVDTRKRLDGGFAGGGEVVRCDVEQ